MNLFSIAEPASLEPPKRELSSRRKTGRMKRERRPDREAEEASEEAEVEGVEDEVVEEDEEVEIVTLGEEDSGPVTIDRLIDRGI